MDLPSPHISITIIGPIVEQDAHIGCALALRILAEFHTSQHVLTFFNKGNIFYTMSAIATHNR